MSDDDDDFGLHDPRTREERELDLLRDWLAMPNWTFGPGENTLAGSYAEAVCLLAGIDPWHSIWGPDQGFMWTFLPGAREFYGCPYGKTDERTGWALEQNIVPYLDRLKALETLGLARVKVIISHALKAGIIIPWLEAARSDPECAKYLPKQVQQLPGQSLASNDYRQASRVKAKKRWQHDDGRKLREGIGKETFNKMVETNFEGLRFKTGGINRSAIADAVRKAIEREAEGEQKVVPSIDTVRRDVRQWLSGANVE